MKHTVAFSNTLFFIFIFQETKGMSSVHSPVAQPPPSTFARATRAWFLASALYDGVEDEDLK